jgi:two-component system aerobic respiration control sensor histidine kinase ArcB
MCAKKVKSQGDIGSLNIDNILALMDFAKVPVICLSLKYHIVAANDLVANLFGTTTSNLINKDFPVFCNEKNILRFPLFARKDEILSGKIIEDFRDVCELFHNEKLKLSWSISRRVDDKNNPVGFILAVKDLSYESLKQELEETKKKNQLENQTKIDFFNNVYNDFQMPLSHIMGFSHMLYYEEIDSNKKNQLNSIIGSGKKILTTLSNMLRFASVEFGWKVIHEKIFEVQELINYIVEIIKPYAEQKGLDFIIDCSGNVPKFLIGDRYRIYCILLNLLSNAVKFTDRGYVKLEMELTQEDEEKGQGILKIVVGDSGIGISEDKFNAIFAKERSLTDLYKNDYDESDLGLQVVKRFIKELNGTIDVESEIGVGSMFTCLIPTRFEKPKLTESIIEIPEKESEEESFATVVQDHPRFLIVEDENMSQFVIKRIMKVLGYTYDLVANATEANRFLSERNYDIILMDVSLPDIDGITLSKEIRYKKKIGTPIVVTTAYSWDKTEYSEAGINGSVNKPLTEDIIKGIVRRFYKQNKVV